MKIDSKQLLQDLKERTEVVIQQTEEFLHFSMEELNAKEQSNSWSVLECLEHLNLYGDFYIPEIQKRISATNTTRQKQFSSGLLGNYFAKSMLPKQQLNKMKTFKDKNPLGSTLSRHTIDRFLDQQNSLLELLKAAAKVDINKVKTAVSISKWIKLKLGDTLRVVIYHNQRHLAQAQRVLSLVSAKKKA